MGNVYGFELVARIEPYRPLEHPGGFQETRLILLEIDTGQIADGG